MQLSTNLCTIRTWRATDGDALVRHANNPRIAAQLRDRFPHPYTQADAERWLAFVATMDPLTSYVLEVEGELVGSIGVVLHSDIDRVSAEIGYWVAEPLWGRGIATAALQAFSTWAFDRFELTRLYATPFADNQASCRVLEKAGYQRVGLLRRAAIKQGQIRDLALYDLIRE